MCKHIAEGDDATLKKEVVRIDEEDFDCRRK